ncbi:MAG: TVP38/TMEM64 family protein [Phormidesmis sp.]
MSIALTWMRRKRTWAGLVIVSCLIVLISQLPLSLWLSQVDDWLAGQGVWTIPIFTLAYVTAAVFGLPNIVLILAAGTLFGLKDGVIHASFADTLSIAACFVIGQRIGRKRIITFLHSSHRLQKLDHAFAQKGWKIVLLTRLSPVLPSNILNYGFSVTRINFWEYLFFSWLGMLPVIFMYVYVGAFGGAVLTLSQEPKTMAFQALGLLATIGVMIYTTRLATSALNHPDS